jgi:hypothetical protein
VVAVAALWACGCKSKQEGGMATAGSGAPTTAAPAVEPPTQGSAVAIDAPPAPDAAAPAPGGDAAYALPADARKISEREARKADATALGADVTVRLVEKVTGDVSDGVRHVDQLVELAGTGAVLVEIGYSLDDDAPSYRERPLRTVAPLAPPRAFREADAALKLAFAGPLLYLKHWKGGDVAVAKDGDAVVVWRSPTLLGEGEDGGAEPWFEQARIKLAPGAKLTAK